jgi:hypothetical protein
MDYHAHRTRKPTQAEIAQELHRLASLLEVVAPLANIIDSPAVLVGVTVISEEDGCKVDKAKPL